MSVFKRFDHIGIVVNDLKKATQALAHFFDLKCQEQLEIEEAGIRIAFYPLGVGQMELIEFQKPFEDLDPIVTRPAASVQHVAWQVVDFDQTLKELIDKGLKVVDGFPRKGAHGKVAFFYPPQGLDLMVEICETDCHHAD